MFNFITCLFLCEKKSVHTSMQVSTQAAFIGSFTDSWLIKCFWIWIFKHINYKVWLYKVNAVSCILHEAWSLFLKVRDHEPPLKVLIDLALITGVYRQMIDFIFCVIIAGEVEVTSPLNGDDLVTNIRITIIEQQKHLFWEPDLPSAI